MTSDELNNCAALLGAVALNFANLPDEKGEALEAGLTCVAVQSLLVELAAHLGAGLEPLDAYAATARGTLKVPGSAATVLQILVAKPKA